MSFSRDGKPFIIAEMSGNHNQSLERALQIVDAAAEAGVSALKLQTYTADTMTIDKRDGEFFISDPNSLWEGESLYNLYKKAYTPWEWHKPIFDRCKERGIICFSTPFDATAVDFLEELDNPIYKIASFENIDIPLQNIVNYKESPSKAQIKNATTTVVFKLKDRLAKTYKLKEGEYIQDFDENSKTIVNHNEPLDKLFSRTPPKKIIFFLIKLIYYFNLKFPYFFD